MWKVTIILGIILIALGAASFVVTGSQHPTSLIPAVIGLILAVLGFFSRTENAKKRMLYMHIAVTIGLLGFLGTAWSIVQYFQMLSGHQFPHPIAVEEKAAMAAILLFFVLLSVRSFISARRSRA